MSKVTRKRIGIGAACAAALVVAYEAAWRPWAARWGATDEEVQRTWPGDEFVHAATYHVTHAVTIHAPAVSCR